MRKAQLYIVQMINVPALHRKGAHLYQWAGRGGHWTADTQSAQTFTDGSSRLETYRRFPQWYRVVPVTLIPGERKDHEW